MMPRGAVICLALCALLALALAAPRTAIHGNASNASAEPRDAAPAKVLVVSDFTQIGRADLEPLLNQWESEGYSYELVDIGEALAADGADNAERMRNFVRGRHEEAGVTHLFIIDIIDIADPHPVWYTSAWGPHAVPARLYPSQESWNDYYFANLYGDFDADGDGEYCEDPSDISGAGGYDVVVGRLVLTSPGHGEQLRRYVEADVAYRTAPSMEASIVIHRRDDPEDSTLVDGHTVPFIDNLIRVLEGYGYNIFDNVYNYPSADEVHAALRACGFAYFAGHGDPGGQQVGYAGEPGSYVDDAAGAFVHAGDFAEWGDLGEPAVMFFKGCNTANMYDALLGARATVAVAPMIYSRAPAVAVVVSTGYGMTFSGTDCEILARAGEVTLAEAVLAQHAGEITATRELPDGSVVASAAGLARALSYGYLGDPTIHLAAA